MTNSKDSHLLAIIQGCREGQRKSQKELYQHFFGLAMSICLRYAPNRDEAQEILNDGFMKVFTKLDKYDPNKPFGLWLRRVMINTAIDHYRKQNRNVYSMEIAEVRGVAEEAKALSNLGEEEILNLVQELPPSYRTVFNLYVMEGYKHEDIAQELGIHVGTSKSNLSKARKHLQRKLRKLENTANGAE